MRPTHHRGGIRRHPMHSGRSNLFYLYEDEPKCYCNGVPCVCPLDVGVVPDSDFLTIFPGWNVWDVYQVNDLPFSFMMLGVSPERQLRIWVEDAVRLGAPGATVADSIDLKGGQVEILNGPPSGLQVAQSKENVTGPLMFVSGPATLKTVRFFNRGSKATMAWPHDESYLLNSTYVPSNSNPATSGPPPSTIGSTVGGGVVSPIADAVKSAGIGPGTVATVAVIGLGVLVYLNRGLVKRVIRKRK